MSKVQGPHERAQGTHLPQAAEVEMSVMRQSQNAEAEISYRQIVLTTGGRLANAGPQECPTESERRDIVRKIRKPAHLMGFRSSTSSALKPPSAIGPLYSQPHYQRKEVSRFGALAAW
jgi:hypothetical protein